MTYLADAQYRGDRESISAIERAEARHGIKTGARFDAEGNRLLVTVTLYPSVKFWVEDLDKENQPSNRRPLTKAEFDQTRGLQL